LLQEEGEEIERVIELQRSIVENDFTDFKTLDGVLTILDREDDYWVRSVDPISKCGDFRPWRGEKQVECR